MAGQVDKDLRVAAKQYGFSDFRKPTMGEPMAPPRAPSASKYAQVQMAGFEHPVPMAVDAGGMINWNAAVCAPNGVTSQVKPKWGQRTQADMQHINRMSRLAGRADMTKVQAPPDDHT